MPNVIFLVVLFWVAGFYHNVDGKDNAGIQPKTGRLGKFVSQVLKERPCDNLGSLRLVHVLFRHGHRTPEKSEFYKNDPYANDTFYPFGIGQLIIEGIRREYSVGKALRKRYDSFLGKDFTPDILDARSTNYNRTKASLELVLAGLFPPSRRWFWNILLPWTPIPYNYWRIEEDFVLGDPVVACPRYKEELEASNRAKLRRGDFDKDKEILSYITANSGRNFTTPYDVFDSIYFALEAEATLSLKLPEWTQKVWPEPITEYTIQAYYLMTNNTRFRRLAGGFLLAKIVEDTLAKVNGSLSPPGRKLFLYSAHENIMAYLLIKLGVFYPHIPPYGSYVAMEVHEIDGEYGFKILYEDYTQSSPSYKKIPDCGVFCPLERFVSIMQDYLPESTDECNL